MPPSRRLFLPTAITLALTAAPSLHAATTAATPGSLRSHIAALQSVTAACAFEASNCDPGRVGPDDTLGDPKQTGGYTVQWSWLREAIHTAAKAKPDDRAKAMKQAQAHLTGLLVELNAPTAQNERFEKALGALKTTLARNEFQLATPTSWWDRQKARIWNWLARGFSGLDNFSSNKPWLGRTLEALFFLAAAVGLLLFVRQQLAQQRLRVTLNTPATRASGWAVESTAWTTLAERYAAEGDFREAIHCLFWAAILLLESRRAWRHDPSRTPREYVRLLPPGSPQREHLQALTARFERTWYGINPATTDDYAAAHGHVTALESNQPAEAQAA